MTIAWVLWLGLAVTAADAPPSPEESLKALRLADPNLSVFLAASEPAVVDPVAIAWDAGGDLFVVEMTDYPNAGTKGRVKRLRDADGDGRYESAVIFAEGLPYPSGLLPWRGGLLVTAAPDLLWLRDTDGDGRADQRRVILTGFGEGNQQLRVNSPTFGLDGRVYLANGRSGGSVRRPDQPESEGVPIPRNDLRVDPNTGAFEPVVGFSQFGLPRDDWGDRFPSWNTVPWRHVVLEVPPGKSGAEGRVAEILDLADGGRIFSASPAQRRFNKESVACFNATCGPLVVRGGGLGGDYPGHLLVCEPLTSIVHHRRLEPQGPTYLARRVDNERDREFLASAHSWFRPVNLAEGPDGALYVVDFCRAWVEHPAFVPENLRGAVDFREGHDRGRIWRIARKGANAKRLAKGPLPPDVPGLVAALEDPNGWRRDTAQRLLMERRDPAAIGPLAALAVSSANAVSRVQALWTLESLGGLDDATLRRAFGDASPRVREQAVRLASRRDGFAGDLARLVGDEDERVRLRLASALGRLEGAAALDTALRLADRDAGSPWFATALLDAVGDRPVPVLQGLLARWNELTDAPRASLLGRLAQAVGARNRLEEVREILAGLGAGPNGTVVLAGLLRGQAGAKDALLSGRDVEGAEARRAVARLLSQAEEIAGSDRSPDRVRLAALEALLAGRSPTAGAIVTRWLDPAVHLDLQRAAAQAVATLNEPKVVEPMLADWERQAIATRRVALQSLVTTPELAAALLDAVQAGHIPRVELDPSIIDALRSLPGDTIRDRLRLLVATGPDADRGAVVARRAGDLALPTDADRGRRLFEQHCRTCHARDGVGAKVGPDLTAVAGRPAADLLMAILDPSRDVPPDGRGFVVATTAGQTLTGLLVEETPASVRLRQPEGLERVIPRAEVEALRTTGRSLMPDGFEQILPPQDLADLIAYLRRAGPAS